MSAYVVNNKTINVIASGFLDMDLNYRNKENEIYTASLGGLIYPIDEIGHIIATDLLKANYDSVNYRYNENTEPHEIKFEKVAYNLGELLGCIKCFNYQACEVPQWEDSLIYKDLQCLKNAILENAIKRLGFEIPWGVADDEKPQF